MLGDPWGKKTLWQRMIKFIRSWVNLVNVWNKTLLTETSSVLSIFVRSSSSVVIFGKRAKNWKATKQQETIIDQKERVDFLPLLTASTGSKVHYQVYQVIVACGKRISRGLSRSITTCARDYFWYMDNMFNI